MNCLDTYALVEIQEGNPAFVDLFHGSFVVTDITLAEFYGVLYRRMGQQTADYWRRKIEPFVVDVSRDMLIVATKYRIDNNKEDLSFVDCVGYMYSIENGIPFVTGDKAFKNKKGVRFIK
jgi:predicted nucleic acid-binding protein